MYKTDELLTVDEYQGIKIRYLERANNLGWIIELADSNDLVHKVYRFEPHEKHYSERVMRVLNSVVCKPKNRTLLPRLEELNLFRNKDVTTLFQPNEMAECGGSAIAFTNGTNDVVGSYQMLYDDIGSKEIWTTYAPPPRHWFYNNWIDMRYSLDALTVQYK